MCVKLVKNSRNFSDIKKKIKQKSFKCNEMKVNLMQEELTSRE